MKKSEMIKNLSSGLKYVNAKYSTDDSHEAVAELLLNLAEEAGMEPPKCGKFKQENVSNRWGVTDFSKTETVRVITNEWESEN